MNAIFSLNWHPLGIDVIKTSASKECLICVVFRQRMFQPLSKLSKLQTDVCNRC